MARPRLLDLFAGAGGSAAGYVRAGFEVHGVDHRPQPRYLLSGASSFTQADALDFLAAHGREFDVIHASPPCQAYTVGRKIHDSGHRHPDLVARARDLLVATGRPWVIENVQGAPLGACAMLCGTMFGLRVFRHRFFESSVLLLSPSHHKHPRGDNTGATDGYSTGKEGYVCVAGNNFEPRAGALAMGIDWMGNRRELAQAIPPAYTEFVGRQLLAAL